MPNSVFFIQDCPTCGRRLQVRVEHLGKKMVCDHCQGRFLARDPANAPSDFIESDLLRRADALLRSLESQHAGRKVG